MYLLFHIVWCGLNPGEFLSKCLGVKVHNSITHDGFEGKIQSRTGYKLKGETSTSLFWVLKVSTTSVFSFSPCLAVNARIMSGGHCLVVIPVRQVIMWSLSHAHSHSLCQVIEMCPNGILSTVGIHFRKEYKRFNVDELIFLFCFYGVWAKSFWIIILIQVYKCINSSIHIWCCPI